MAAALYSQEIQNILEAVQAYKGGDIWSDVLSGCTVERDRSLTSTLCSVDCADFIVMDGSDAFMFVNNEQTGEWNVIHVGQPVYEVEPEMIGDSDVDFDAFLSELRHELAGVEVKQGSALRNIKSEFVQAYQRELDKAFQSALENL